jgi:hypothetical protein
MLIRTIMLMLVNRKQITPDTYLIVGLESNKLDSILVKEPSDISNINTSQNQIVVKPLSHLRRIPIPLP